MSAAASNPPLEGRKCRRRTANWWIWCRKPSKWWWCICWWSWNNWKQIICVHIQRSSAESLHDFQIFHRMFVLHGRSPTKISIQFGDGHSFQLHYFVAIVVISQHFHCTLSNSQREFNFMSKCPRPNPYTHINWSRDATHRLENFMHFANALHGVNGKGNIQ